MAYDIVQTVFLLNVASNGVSSISETQSDLQSDLAVYLNGGTTSAGKNFAGFFPTMNSQLAGGDWAVTWGPCVYSTNPTSAAPAANAMFVAYSASLSTYVVAIAATNPTSLYDWVHEDGEVQAVNQAKWPPTLPYVATTHLPWIINPPAAVSEATATGLSNLLSQPAMTDPKKGTLQSYLASVASSSDTLIFTGHSLAGALSPTVAYYLYPNPSASGWKNVFVLPTAGATPGNGPFAKAFIKAYPPTSVAGVSAAYGQWNVDFANQHDVVPHAWNQLSAVVSTTPDTDGNYTSIFGVLNAGLGKDLNTAIKAAKDLALGGDYTNLSQATFNPAWGAWSWQQNADGSWQYPPTWTTLPPYTDANPATAADLGSIIRMTHIDQYFNFFNVIPGPRLPTDPASAQAAATKRKAEHAAAAAHA